MNVIFTVIILVSAAVLLFVEPSSFLTAMLSGAKSALLLCVSLFCVYAVWLSLSQAAQKSGLNKKAAKLIKPACVKFFKTRDDEAAENIAMNLTCNLLGIGGAATPFGVKAVERLEAEGNDYAQKLLFILNATSLQILPTTVIALRAGAGSCNPADIFLPTLISTGVCTFTGVIAFLGVNKIWRR